MDVSEFLVLSDEEKLAVVQSLSGEEWLDVVDAMPVKMKEFTQRDDRIYFDDLDEYCAYLESNTHLDYPIDVIYSHELAHAQCARALGVASVRYYVQIIEVGGFKIETGAFTESFGPIELPNLAYASIAVAPQSPSSIDMRTIRPYGYPSVDFVAERIHRWNMQDRGLVIPVPGSLETPR